MNTLTYQPNLNTNAQYPNEIELYPGTGITLSYSIGFGWRIRRALKSFYNLSIVIIVLVFQILKDSITMRNL